MAMVKGKVTVMAMVMAMERERASVPHLPKKQPAHY
jgi:hypothetical protein